MLIVAASAMTGCEETAPPPAASEVAAPDLTKVKLTAEIWKEMEHEEKYSIDMLKRLRSEDPSLRSAAAWKKFEKEVVKPGFERDILKKDPGTAQPQAI